MDKLPVVLSIPHGGDQIPPEVKKRISLTQLDIFQDGDSLTRDIYGFRDKVVALLDTSIARAAIDLNRAPDDRPPKNPDGVIKTSTVTGASVYKEGLVPEEKLVQELLDRYYFPYHRKLSELSNRPGIRIGFDCHSMLPKPPVYNNTPAKKRPLICLSNGGDSLGRPLTSMSRITCLPEIIQQLAECFKEVFEIPDEEIALNSPFQGGHIVRTHSQHKIPWIQIEINKKLYLPASSKNNNSISYSENKLMAIKEKIWMVFNLFFLNF